MAIKTGVHGSIPAINLDHVQYSQLNISIKENPPYTVSLSARVKAYGVENGVKYYDKKPLPPMIIQDLDAYMQHEIPNDRKADAAQALADIQKGLGVLASIKYNVDFVGVE